MMRGSRTGQRARSQPSPGPRGAAAKGPRRKHLVFAWWALVTLLIAGVATLMLTSRHPRADLPLSAQQVLQIRDDDWVRGNRFARVVLVAYFDFECPACAAHHWVLRDLEREFGDDLAIVPRHFPLAVHLNSMPAALAAEAAGLQGKYWPMHDLLFQSQDEWGSRTRPDSQQFIAYAERIGVDSSRFASDTANPRVMSRIEQHLREARALRVVATPTYFVNGQTIRTPSSLSEFRSLIDRERRKVSAAKPSSG